MHHKGKLRNLELTGSGKPVNFACIILQYTYITYSNTIGTSIHACMCTYIHAYIHCLRYFHSYITLHSYVPYITLDLLRQFPLCFSLNLSYSEQTIHQYRLYLRSIQSCRLMELKAQNKSIKLVDARSVFVAQSIDGEAPA